MQQRIRAITTESLVFCACVGQRQCMSPSDRATNQAGSRVESVSSDSHGHIHQKFHITHNVGETLAGAKLASPFCLISRPPSNC